MPVENTEVQLRIERLVTDTLGYDFPRSLNRFGDLPVQMVLGYMDYKVQPSNGLHHDMEERVNLYMEKQKPIEAPSGLLKKPYIIVNLASVDSYPIIPDQVNQEVEEFITQRAARSRTMKILGEAIMISSKKALILRINKEKFN